MQSSFDFPLTDFEQATLEQLISYKCKSEDDIERLMNDPKNIKQAKVLVNKWSLIRKKKNLKTYK